MPPEKDFQKDVFTHCRNAFAGQNALIRRSKKIKEILDKHKGSIKPLLQSHKIDKIAECAQFLLQNGIFESGLKAKIFFPELFETSSSRGVQRAESVSEAGRAEAEAFAEIQPEAVNGLNGLTLDDVPEGSIVVTSSPPPASSTKTEDRSPTLFPAYLSYKGQHHILTAVQAQLERTGFEFYEKYLPNVLEDNGWDCPEALELTKFTRKLKANRRKIPAEACGAIPLTEQVIFAPDKLRHAAVHRLPMTAASVQQLILSAVDLARALNATADAARIEEANQELHSLIQDIEANKELLESRLDKELKRIDEQRAALDRMEEEAIATMLRDDKEYNKMMGQHVSDRVLDRLEGKPDQESLQRVDTVKSRQESYEDDDPGDIEAPISDKSPKQEQDEQSPLGLLGIPDA